MIDQLAKQLVQDIQGFLNAGEKPEADKIKSLLEAKLRQLDLVTREEFDAQVAVLARTRKLLEDLEKEISELSDSADTP